MDKEIGISELVKGVHQELIKVKNDKEIEENPLVSLKNLELTLNVAISKATEAGIKFFVISADREVKKEQISTIKLGFEPLVQVTPKKVEIAKGAPVLASPVTEKKQGQPEPSK